MIELIILFTLQINKQNISTISFDNLPDDKEVLEI